MSGPARHQGGEEMKRTSQMADLALSADKRQSLVELDPHVDLPLPGQESLTRAKGRIQGFKECVQPARLLRVVEKSPSGLIPSPRVRMSCGSKRTMVKVSSILLCLFSDLS